MQKIYLAGPEVFLPDAAAIGRRKKDLCAKYGFEGLFPFDNEVDAAAPGADRLIYEANVAMIRRADLGICNLTPFRGPSADAGTVFELGLLTGLGKRVFGYSNVTDDYLARCRRLAGVGATGQTWRDAAGMSIENFGNADNLMIDKALIAHGGQKLVRHQASPKELFADLAGFETCLRLAAGRQATVP